MNTKNKLIARTQRARSDCDECLTELLTLVYQAILHSEVEDIDWYVMNTLPECDILLFVALADTDLSIHFDETVIVHAVRYVFSSSTS
ncbi:conserved hypothetical protein [Vibrio crassostreae]|nr:hypothetical protein EDB59_2812 [Vibrio crassostreae]CAK2774930.1 conserved hypothetical protein [Vibrio crassostreae]